MGLVAAVVRFPPAVVLLVPAVVTSPSPGMDEAAIVPLVAVALQKVLAGTRLELGVVVIGDSSSFPEIGR